MAPVLAQISRGCLPQASGAQSPQVLAWIYQCWFKLMILLHLVLLYFHIMVFVFHFENNILANILPTAPQISSISPNIGATFGSEIVISGSYFGVSSDVNRYVRMGGALCEIVSYSDTSVSLI